MSPQPLHTRLLHPWALLKRLWRKGLWAKAALTASGAAILLFILLQIAIVALPFDDSALSGADVSTIVTDANGQLLRAYTARDDRWRIPARLDQISPWVVKATLATEDKRFYSHHGIDWFAVARAAVSNFQSRRINSGASTISMQVAGFLINSRERSLSRKLHQAFLALQLERRWSKTQILESYLTHASYGGNVCGIEAAARRYFNKRAAQLSGAEAALLAGIPQRPEYFRPDKNLARAKQRREFVLARMVENGSLTQTDYERYRVLPISAATYAEPVRAPHFCDAVTKRYPGEKRLRTTLRLELQSQCESLLSAAVAERRLAGVSNGAVVVLENSTANIIAMAGSVDYWNSFHHGQVNAALGYRSPGSTLKPFIYGEALDLGLLQPDEMLFDVPITINGYSPANFDSEFHGPTPASKALAWSLNIPAITVLNRVGVDTFLHKMASAGVRLRMNPQGEPGLSVAIGTCSARLLDLTAAYCALANRGVMRTPGWLSQSRRLIPGHIILSPNAAAAIRTVLADPAVRPPEVVDASLSGLQNVAWKTGTSNGYRDAWTFAVTPHYTIGVWMGNMDGRPGRGLVGGQAAAPLALRLAKYLDGPAFGGVGTPDTGMIAATACLESGMAAGPLCRDTVMARFLAGAEPAECKIHREVPVDDAMDVALCPACIKSHRHHNVTVAQFPDGVDSWLRLTNHPWAEQLAPPHNPTCARAAGFGSPPVITTPKDNEAIVLMQEYPLEYQKLSLSARADQPYAPLYWFVDDVLVGVKVGNEPLPYMPAAGRHHIKCVDSFGRSSQVTIIVENEPRPAKWEWSHLSDSN